MNRYRESNLVYGLVNGLKLNWLENLDTGLPKSDLVIVLDVPQTESFKRKRLDRDRFEKNRAFSQKISKTYRMYKGIQPPCPMNQVYGLACLELG